MDMVEDSCTKTVQAQLKTHRHGKNTTATACRDWQTEVTLLLIAPLYHPFGDSDDDN